MALSTTNVTTAGENPARSPITASNPNELPWLTSIETALEEARQSKRPVLVDVGAEWCGWCDKLDVEIRRPEVQAKLATWTLVRIDADKNPDDARKLAAAALPALRILANSGRTIAAHDGFLKGEDLIKWLDRSYKSAAAGSELSMLEPKTPADAEAMLGELTASDALVREAAIRLLARRPDLAAPAAVKAFESAKLASRLALLELLTEWKAPLDGVDPWEPASITPQRLEILNKWSAKVQPPAAAPVKPTTGPSSATRPSADAAGDNGLAPEALAAARRDIALMLAADGAFEVRAVRERLARVGAPLVPEVMSRLTAAATEDERFRLAALRYRLSASNALASAWPDGFERLASGNADTRHRAVDELAGKAGADDGPLLLALFTDPDPLVRETSLRVLRSMGGETAANIVELLKDPEPNVRAAVLKQLAEAPTPEAQGAVIAFLQIEQDPDLIVHGVRVLRELKTKESADALMGLLAHESWRVRAEAAESLGKLLENRDGSSKRKTTQTAGERREQIYAALVKLLDDPDSFVVSRAVIVLRDANSSTAIEPLVAAAQRRPELAPDVVRALSRDPGSQTSQEHLRQFSTHANAAVREAAIQSLATANAHAAGPELRKVLNDQSSSVRIAAAKATATAIEGLRPDPNQEISAGGVSFFGFGGSKRKPRDMETWLKDFRAGKGRPSWLNDLVEPLERMAASTAAAEAAAAAVPLAALGRDDKALPALQRAATSDAAARATAAAALPWLPWEQRLVLFKSLVAHAAREELSEYVESLSKMPSPQAATVLWETLGSAAADVELAGSVHQALPQVYLGNRYYDHDSPEVNAKRQPLIQAAQAQLAGGTDMQRLVALALLAEQSAKDVIEPAQRLLNERPANDPLRIDAFHVLLLARHATAPKDAEAAAMAALAAADSPYEMRKTALRYLSLREDGLHQLRYAIWLSVMTTSIDDTDEGHIPRPPEGLKAELIRPMLQDEDSANAACAGYLLCLLGDRGGLEPLVAHWRKSTHDESMRQLVYGAVASLGDDGLTPILQEVYTSMSGQPYYVRGLHQAISAMKGENVAKLRKQMLEEVGKEELK